MKPVNYRSCTRLILSVYLYCKLKIYLIKTKRDGFEKYRIGFYFEDDTIVFAAFDTRDKIYHRFP